MTNKVAIKIALIYFTIGFLWILFSDQFILKLAGTSDAITIIQTYKGWFYVSITAVLLYFLIHSEIKKKNKIEQELIKAKTKSEESDHLKSAFLSNMSHEIRTPLNGILGFSELLVDDSFNYDDKIIFAKNLTKSGNDLLKLINDIMDISKIKENQFAISNKKFALNNLLSIIYSEYQQSDKKAIQDHVSLKLLNGNNEIELFSDPIIYMHVFRNLLNNACFNTYEGFIHFGYEETESGIVLFVEDTGCGIDESSKDLIFKPFFKGKKQVVGSKGFGLGLAISKGLVKLLGSDLQFSSAINKGTRFYFCIDNKDIVSKNPLSHKLNKASVKIDAVN